MLAAAATLALNPRATGDIGWQLSFAAVLGILAAAAPLARLFGGPQPGARRRALSEAAALTVAATLATAPLMALHFGTVSVLALPANLLAVPAEAPVMWLGMLAAAVGQVSSAPVEPLTWLAGLLAGYIDQVAAWFAAPAWAQPSVGLGGPWALAGVYATLGSALAIGLRLAARRQGLRPAAPPMRAPAALAGLATVAMIAAVLVLTAPATRSAPGGGLAITVLDVGQGDAILLAPRGGDPILVDAGPAAAGVAGELDRRGIDELAALVLTHSDSDHTGGAPAVLQGIGATHLVVARADSAVRAAAAAADGRPQRVAAGSTLRSAGLRLRVLWPPSARRGELDSAAQPNAASLVLLARWHRFRILLTGDAEAELAPVHPGDVDVLKIAHHGSEDAGLRALLTESTPELAVISVGAENPYGHPSPSTLASLAAAGVPSPAHRPRRRDHDLCQPRRLVGRTGTRSCRVPREMEASDAPPTPTPAEEEPATGGWRALAIVLAIALLFAGTVIAARSIDVIGIPAGEAACKAEKGCTEFFDGSSGAQTLTIMLGIASGVLALCAAIAAFAFAATGRRGDWMLWLTTGAIALGGITILLDII